MTQDHTHDAGPREHYRRAAACLALALAGAACAGVALAVTWQRPQLYIALLGVVYAFVTGLFAVERAAGHLAAARP